MADVYVINKTSIDVTKLAIESFIENYGPKVSMDWNLEGRTASITKNGDLQSSKLSVI